MNPITLGAAELAEAIRRGQLTPSAVVEGHIAQIEAVNPALNAVVTPLFEQARQQAAAADNQQKHADLPPLFGVPITIKDALAVEGVRHTAGYWPMRDLIAEEDAIVVQRLKAAGAIILGKTNCPDLSMSVETENPIFGLTRNAWHPDYTAGGSSGGEGAIIGAGGSPLGIGSDIAGSIRMPAAMNGTVGLKPTGGRIPTEGHIPQVTPDLEGWNTVGPLARRVDDLHLVLRVLSDTPVTPLEAVDLNGRKAIIPRYPWLFPPHPEAKRAAYEAVNVLELAGMRADYNGPVPTQRAMLLAGAGIYNRGLRFLHGEINEVAHISEGTRANLRGGALFARPLKLMGIRGSDRQIARMRERVLGAMGPGGVMVYPVWMDPPPTHGVATTLRGTPAYAVWVNMLGLPAVAVPVGFASSGLPLSVQIIARPGEDEVALAAARHIEQAFGGWRLPPQPSMSR